MADPASEELAGAVAIVTGAAGGAGRATVELLMVSPRSSIITGAILMADGGFTAQ
jgi:NADP-dependent 3-hydroxy acid dehydrogenase YdfG